MGSGATPPHPFTPFPGDTEDFNTYGFLRSEPKTQSNTSKAAETDSSVVTFSP